MTEPAAAYSSGAVQRAKEHFASHATPMTEPPCDAHALAADVLVLAREADGLRAECDGWREAAETWGRVERKLNRIEGQYDALVAAARTTSHGDHDYDLDAPPRMDCVLCAAIESRWQPRWMEEPYEWLCDPIVKEEKTDAE